MPAHAVAERSFVSLLVALAQVFCLDGDGGALMHLGAMSTIGTANLPNFRHILLNNGAHDSVGGQYVLGLVGLFAPL